MSIDNFEKELAASLGKESAKSLFGFLNSLLDPPAKELGEILRDRLRYYRLKNQVKIIEKAKNYVGKNSVNPVDLKLLDIILESGGAEENDEMQERWATLLANSAQTSSVYINFDLSYAEILKYLSSTEARALETIYLNSLGLHDMASDGAHAFNHERFNDNGVKIHDSLEFMALANSLIRRGVVQYWEDEFHIRLSAFGFKFMRRVTSPTKIKEYKDSHVMPH